MRLRVCGVTQANLFDAKPITRAQHGRAVVGVST